MDSYDSLLEAGAIRQGHFGLLGGKHTNRLVIPSVLANRPDLQRKVCDALLEPFIGDSTWDILFLGSGMEHLQEPMSRLMYGASFFFAQETAQHGKFVFLGHSPQLTDRRVLLVAGGVYSFSELEGAARLVKAQEGEVAGLSAIVDFSRALNPAQAAAKGVPRVHFLAAQTAKACEPGRETCSGCDEGRPVEYAVRLLRPRSLAGV